MDRPQRKRFNREILRRRGAEARQAADTQAQQQRAATNREIARQLSGWTRRRIIGWALITVAAIVAVQHVLAHSGLRPIPLSMGWQDLLVGYPMAGLLLVIAVIVLGQQASRK